MKTNDDNKNDGDGDDAILEPTHAIDFIFIRIFLSYLCAGKEIICITTPHSIPTYKTTYPTTYSTTHYIYKYGNNRANRT